MTKKISCFVLLFLIPYSIFHVPCFSQDTDPTGNASKIAKPLGEFLDSRTGEDAFSGVVMVAKGANVIFIKAYGISDKKTNRLNTVDTRFNIGSLNKMFTAVAIAQLAQQGKLSFDDVVSKFLPDYPDPVVANGVSIRQLLTHTSGLGNYFNGKFVSARTKLTTVQSYLPLFQDDRPSFSPGDKYEYSNEGYIVLGAIIEKASGEDYYSYVKKHIFIPSGMNSTGFYMDDSAAESMSVAVGFTDFGGKPGELKPNTDLREVRGGPAGGGYSSANDLLKFREALFGNTLLTPAYTDTVLTGRVTTPFGMYAFGFGVEHHGTQTILGHAGGIPGAFARLDMYPDLGYTVVILSNLDAPGSKPVVEKIRELIK
ncbi:MAG TPA: serine hydrolase domain-containing protein [Bacteroidota bacterium]|nr:serine hydrolase domain-containing protein [Bacteroidota bacterium]